MFASLIPIWNAVVFIGSRIFYEGVVTTAIRELPLFYDMGSGIASFTKVSVASGSDYVNGMMTACPTPESVICYDPGRRSLDVIRPMGELRGIAGTVAKLARTVCRSATAPIDLILYPFMDINFAKGLHNVVNAVFFTLFQLPIVTAERCKHSGGELLLCMPDFEPSFNFLVAGLRSFGMLGDNFLDVGSIIVQSSLGFDPDLQCDQIALAITPLNKSTELFADSQTAVVGLTEGLYAITDGLHVQYFSHYNSVVSSVAKNAFPLQVDPSFGFAAVTYFETDGQHDDVGNPSTAIMGCRCDDDANVGVRIRCAFALYGSTLNTTLDRTFETVFHQRSTATQLTCKEAEISVQSVRWPVKRFTKVGGCTIFAQSLTRLASCSQLT